jgi:ABC-2 type transport system ATP-binding protein
MKPEVAVAATALTRKFGEEITAVDGINLSVPANTIYALLGPNGAGKTTTISMLATLLSPTSGTATVAGLDICSHPDLVRRKIGITFQEILLEPDFTGRENLDYQARLYGMKKEERLKRIGDLLSLMELEEAADRRTGTYSGGMKRRLELARGLLTGPELLILDEPTQGLDPQNRARIWAYIKDLQRTTGITVLLTTHYMDEAEAVSDRVAIIDRGVIVAEGAPGELIDEMGSESIRIIGRGNMEAFSGRIRSLPFVETLHALNGVLQIGVDSGNRRLAPIVDQAGRSGFEIEDISVAKPNLEDVFLQYTGRQLRDK